MLQLVGQNLSSIILEDSEGSACVNLPSRSLSFSLSYSRPALPLPTLAASDSDEISALLVSGSQEKNLTMILSQIEEEINY